MTERLTSLVAVRQWLGITDPASVSGDPLLTRVIDGASQFILQYTSHSSFAGADYQQRFRGNGRSRFLVRNSPIISVDSVAIGGTLLSASTFLNGMPSVGYYVSDTLDVIELFGWTFAWSAPCQLVYRAGYEGSENVVIGVDPITPSTLGSWSTPVSVKEGSTLWTRVMSNPSASEYTISSWGEYVFAVADQGKTITIEYGYTPHDLSLATTQLVGEWFTRKDRIGLLSKSLGGQETVSFQVADMSAEVALKLQQFVNVVPH